MFHDWFCAFELKSSNTICLNKDVINRMASLFDTVLCAILLVLVLVHWCSTHFEGTFAAPTWFVFLAA